MFASSWFKLCAFFQSRGFCCHVWRLQATTAWSLISQVGLSHSLMVSSPPSRLNRLYSSPSTSLPLCAPNSFGESFMILYILWSIADYLLCRSLEESPRNTSIFYFWWFFSDARIGWHWEGFSSWRAWGGDRIEIRLRCQLLSHNNHLDPDGDTSH